MLLALCIVISTGCNNKKPSETQTSRENEKTTLEDTQAKPSTTEESTKPSTTEESTIPSTEWIPTAEDILWYEGEVLDPTDASNLGYNLRYVIDGAINNSDGTIHRLKTRLPIPKDEGVEFIDATNALSLWKECYSQHDFAEPAIKLPLCDPEKMNELTFHEDGYLTIDDVSFDLQMNNQYSEMAENIVVNNVTFYILDIDRTDRFVEVIAHFYAYLDGDTTKIPQGKTLVLRYNGKDLYQLAAIYGSIAHFPEEAERTEDKTIKVLPKIEGLFTCFETIHLKNGKLYREEQEYYELQEVDADMRNMEEYNLRIEESLEIYVEADENSDKITLEPQQIDYVKTDATKWLQIKGLDDGVIGWCRLEEVESSNIFKGTK